jgi:uncharacterized membrane protein YgcG
MRDKRTTLCVAVMIAVAAGGGVLASKRQRIESHWRDRDVVIDGDNGEWAGPLLPVDENHPIITAAMNDGQFLYVVLSTSDMAARRQIMRQGLIVWFDPSGGDKKHFGVKFPVGMLPEDASGRRGGYRRGPGGGRPAGDPRSTDPAQPDQPAQLEPTNRLEVYGPQKDDAHSFVTDMAPGIAVKVGEVQGYLVYELKVPLARTADWPYAVEAKPGALIGFGLETPKMERPSREGQSGMGGFGGRGGGMGGRGGGMGGRRGGSGDDRQREQPKPLKSWATIQLAANR